MFWPLGHLLQHYSLANLDTCNWKRYKIIACCLCPLPNINAKAGWVLKLFGEKHCINIQCLEYLTAPHKDFCFSNRNTRSFEYNIRPIINTIFSSQTLKALATFLWAEKVPAKAEKKKSSLSWDNTSIMRICPGFHQHLQIDICKQGKRVNEEPNQERMTQDAAHKWKLDTFMKKKTLWAFESRCTLKTLFLPLL